MYSLTFLSAQQLVKDEEATCKILESLPRVIYKILFNVAFKDNRTKLLYELVKTWPYSKLKFQMLLQTCWCCSRTSSKKCTKCQWTLTHDKLNKNKINTIFLGVRSYIKKVITEGSQQPPDRRLQQLDMTGLFCNAFLEDLSGMDLWTSLISQSQVYISYEGTGDSQSQTRDQVAETSPSPMEAHVDLLMDLYINPISKDFLAPILQGNANSSLRLICRDLYVFYLFDSTALNLLPLLEPLALRRIDLLYTNITSIDIRWFMSQITTFHNLQSLKLPSFTKDEHWWENPELKAKFDVFVIGLNKLKNLKEIALDDTCLSGQVEYLLGDLQCSLESLQLSFCSLTNKDLTYLAQSHYSTHLIKLDLTGNNIPEQLNSFLKLLKSVSTSLMWLNVTTCKIKDTDFYQIIPYLYSCTKLSYLCLFGNPLSSISILTFLGQCHQKLCNMKAISIPIFLDCCPSVTQYETLPMDLENEMDKKKFFAVMNKMCQLPALMGDSAIQYNFSHAFDIDDYFDLQKVV
ncbi:leucine-rich repeat-containing protein 14-like [Antechinus flavipes]|uniref:leucine-rich repeat-containing protein 14-like n=1 Tax=Antechinus flavipes TaxID=38775 RepID=UPI0022357E59|nr:leucine-rich repeat-containing protein 14-like [Antechinus flavipes]